MAAERTGDEYALPALVSVKKCSMRRNGSGEHVSFFRCSAVANLWPSRLVSDAFCWFPSAQPYDYDALEPHLDEATLRVHHGGHHAVR